MDGTGASELAVIARAVGVGEVVGDFVTHAVQAVAIGVDEVFAQVVALVVVAVGVVLGTVKNAVVVAVLVAQLAVTVFVTPDNRLIQIAFDDGPRGRRSVG